MCEEVISCIFADLFLLIFWCLKCLGFSDRTLYPTASGTVSPGDSALPGTAATRVQTESLSSPATPSSPQICSYWAPIAHPCHDLPNCCSLTPLAFSPSASRLQFSCCHLPASLRIHPTAADPEPGRHHLVQFLQSLLLTSLLLLDTSSSVFSLHCS